MNGLVLERVIVRRTFIGHKVKFNKVFLECVKKFIAQEGVKAIFNQTQLPLTVLLKLLKESDSEWYHSEVESYVYDEQFDIFDFLNCMIPYKEKMVHQSCAGIERHGAQKQATND